jgi:oxygen-independent coproporphyrinogen-3 oxidase
LESAFFEALIRETEIVAGDVARPDRKISTIYIGGGTPSTVNPDHLKRWLDRLNALFAVESDCEFSFEVNPESVDLSYLEQLQAMGVNRLVIGAQAFNPRALKLLGRKHEPHHVHRAIYSANALGMHNIAVDFLFGMPGQKKDQLAADIEQLIDLAPKHISLYQLTIESGTPFAEMYTTGQLKRIDPELVAALYRGSCQQLADAGYRRYEVSSFALDGYECRHNLNYWQGKDYIGLGPSAHSIIGNHHIAVVANVNEYIDALQMGRRPLDENVTDQDARIVEAIAMGLRTAGGIDRAQFASRFGVPIEQRLNRSQYDLLVGSGHLVPDRGKLRLSDEGIDMADEITARLLG